MEQLTRAQMRERIRRDRLGITTPSMMALSTAAEGDCPTYQPDPNNDAINAAIEDALAEVNGEIFFNGSSGTIPVAVAAQTAAGLYTFSLMTAISSYTSAGQINNINHAHFTPTASGVARRLKPKTQMELDRDRPDWMNTPVGLPEYYSIDAYNLSLLPSPSEAGTLYLNTGLSMLAPVDDTDTIDQLPNDFLPVIMDMATVNMIPILIGNVEMQQRAQMLVPRAQQGKYRLKLWYLSQMRDRKDGVTFRSNRPYFTGRRR
jgi:hypothetical protein